MAKQPERSARFRAAVERFDRANAEDPNLETAGEVPRPKELLYAQRMTRTFCPRGI